MSKPAIPLLSALLALPLIIGVPGCLLVKLDPETRDALKGRADATDRVKETESVGDAGEADDGLTSVAEKKEDLDHDLDKARRELSKLEMELEVARLEMQAQEAEGRMAIEKAEVALENSRRVLRDFLQAERPRREMTARTDVDSARFRLRDDEEELAQLEMMYKGSELEDKTSEIVLERGRRQLELSRKRLEIEERQLVEITERDLPREQEEKERAVHEAEIALDEARREAPVAALRKKIALHEAEGSLTDKRVEIEKLERKRKKLENKDEKSKNGKGESKGAR